MNNSRTLAARPPVSCFVAAAALLTVATCDRTFADDDHGLDGQARQTLRQYARNTWRSFEAMVLPNGLPADGLLRAERGAWRPLVFTTPTDIGAYLWSVLAAERLGIIQPVEASRRLDQALSAISRLERRHGFFLDKLDVRTGAPLGIEPKKGRPIHPKLAAVDNGWLAAALIMVRNTHPESRERADTLLKPMNFRFFYDPYDAADPLKHQGQLRGTFHIDSQTFGTPHQLINTEPRIASYIGIARGQIPPEHYYRIFRTLPPDRLGQQQAPQGTWRTYRGVSVFEGHYTYRGMRIVPSWGGSMFEALMVPLFVPEARWAPRSWGVNHPIYVQAQIEHGLDVRRYGFWGFSPSTTPEGGYEPYGVDDLGTNPEGYHSHELPPDQDAGKHEPKTGRLPDGVVTPHASFLALPFAPREAMANLQALRDRFPAIYTPYGFRDSVNLSSGDISEYILALDQGMIMAAVANALADRAMQHAFSDGEVETVIRPLIAPEEFTAGPRDESTSSKSH